MFKRSITYGLILVFSLSTFDIVLAPGAMRDSLGNAFDGGRTYQLHIPSNVPAKDFWSLVVYDTQTRSELQTGNPFPSLNNQRNAIQDNPDGSVDVYFGPRAPKGKESNWIETVVGG